MRKVTVEVKVKLSLTVDDDISVNDVIQDIDYSFTDTTGSATVEDTEILDYEITDSR